MSDKLVCPVTQENFTYPIILECGHTFDKPVLEEMVRSKKNKCPLCNSNFLSIERVNWAVAGALDLNIKTSKKRTTAKEAKEKTLRYRLAVSNKFIDDVVIPEIIGQSERGSDGASFQTSWNMDVDYIKVQLENLGYTVTQDFHTFSWLSGNSSIRNPNRITKSLH